MLFTSSESLTSLHVTGYTPIESDVGRRRSSSANGDTTNSVFSNFLLWGDLKVITLGSCSILLGATSSGYTDDHEAKAKKERGVLCRTIIIKHHVSLVYTVLAYRCSKVIMRQHQAISYHVMSKAYISNGPGTRAEVKWAQITLNTHLRIRIRMRFSVDDTAVQVPHCAHKIRENVSNDKNAAISYHCGCVTGNLNLKLLRGKL